MLEIEYEPLLLYLEEIMQNSYPKEYETLKFIFFNGKKGNPTSCGLQIRLEYTLLIKITTKRILKISDTSMA